MVEKSGQYVPTEHRKNGSASRATSSEYAVRGSLAFIDANSNNNDAMFLLPFLSGKNKEELERLFEPYFSQ